MLSHLRCVEEKKSDKTTNLAISKQSISPAKIGERVGGGILDRDFERLLVMLRTPNWDNRDFKL